MNGKNGRKTNPSKRNDDFIPEEIRGKHYNSWSEIAFDLGYNRES